MSGTLDMQAFGKTTFHVGFCEMDEVVLNKHKEIVSEKQPETIMG
jgi:hypothetical protein